MAKDKGNKPGVKNEQTSKNPDLNKPIVNQDGVKRAEAEQERRKRVNRE